MSKSGERGQAMRRSSLSGRYLTRANIVESGRRAIAFRFFLIVQRLLTAGASGYVLKRSAAEELVRAIRRVAAGQKYLDPAITDQAIGSVTAGTLQEPAARGRLTRREEDVLRSVALGFLAKEIAGRLGISIKTVETHKAKAVIKLGLKNRIEIVRYAMLQGWLQEP